MSDATQTQTLEQTLNKTDLGHYIYEYRKVFLGLVIGVLVAVVAYVAWNESKKAAQLGTSVEVFNFQEGDWSAAKGGKISPEELVGRFQKLPAKVQGSAMMVPVGLEMGKFLFDKGAFGEAEKILSTLNTGNNINAFFVGFQRLAVLEKLGKIEEALSVMEGLAKRKDGLMPARVNLELGRLYLVKGDKNQAKNQFDLVISTYPNDESAKLAKLYLSQLAQ